MFGSIISGLAAAAEAIAAWLRAKQQAKDQNDGIAIQAGADAAKVVSVQNAEIKASVDSRAGPSVSERLRDGSF